VDELEAGGMTINVRFCFISFVSSAGLLGFKNGCLFLMHPAVHTLFVTGTQTAVFDVDITPFYLDIIVKIIIPALVCALRTYVVKSRCVLCGNRALVTKRA